MTAVWIVVCFLAYRTGRHYGYQEGERNMYARCKRAAWAAKGFFSDVSKL